MAVVVFDKIRPKYSNNIALCHAHEHILSRYNKYLHWFTQHYIKLHISESEKHAQLQKVHPWQAFFLCMHVRWNHNKTIKLRCYWKLCACPDIVHQSIQRGQCSEMHQVLSLLKPWQRCILWKNVCFIWIIFVSVRLFIRIFGRLLNRYIQLIWNTIRIVNSKHSTYAHSFHFCLFGNHKHLTVCLTAAYRSLRIPKRTEHK